MKMESEIRKRNPQSDVCRPKPGVSRLHKSKTERGSKNHSDFNARIVPSWPGVNPRKEETNKQ